MVEFWMPPIVEPDGPANVSGLLVSRVSSTPDRPLFAVPERSGWREITAVQFERQVIALAKGLIAAGIEAGERVAVIARTSYDWTLVDFALFYAGAVMVPVYETSSPSQIAWILSDSEAVAVVVGDVLHGDRLDAVRSSLPLIRDVWAMHANGLEHLTARGAAVEDEVVDRRRSLATREDVATLIYTSGSTGRPKGCVLTHGNFIELARNTATTLGKVAEAPDASTLLFITTAHVFARFISVLNIYAGVKTGHQPDTRHLLPALASFQPSFILAVPRVFEKVYNSAEQKAESEGRGKIFHAAAEVAIRHSEKTQSGASVSPLMKLKFFLYDRFVYSKIRSALGGRVSFAISGSAPLSPRLGHFYRSLGIEILEGYGLTETTAPAAVNVPSRSKIGTVGTVLPGTGIRLAEDGEIQVRGAGVFREYWRNPEASAAAFDAGWFKTGDIGTFDEDGYLTVTGRKKELIITAGGKNVSPAPLEDEIRAHPVVGQVVVVGDQKPFVAALITLDLDMLPTWLSNNGLSADMTLDEAARSDRVRAAVQRAVDAANRSVSRAESIRKFVIVPTVWSEGSGHLTPKMSIKRSVIAADYADAIDGIYAIPVDTTNIALS